MFDFLFTVLNLALYITGVLVFVEIVSTTIESHRKRRNIKLIRKLVSAGVVYEQAANLVECSFPINRTPRRR